MSIKFYGKNSPIGREKSSEKGIYNENPFSNEKMFEFDRIYNSENDRIWAVNREEANRRGGIKQQRKFPQKVMVWSESVAPLVLFEKGTLDHRRYIKEVLPVTLR